MPRLPMRATERGLNVPPPSLRWIQPRRGAGIKPGVSTPGNEPLQTHGAPKGRRQPTDRSKLPAPLRGFWKWGGRPYLGLKPQALCLRPCGAESKTPTSQRLSRPGKPPVDRPRRNDAPPLDDPAPPENFPAVPPQPSIRSQGGAFPQQHPAERRQVADQGRDKGAEEISPRLVIDPQQI